MSYKYNPVSCGKCKFNRTCRWRIGLGEFLIEAEDDCVFSGKGCNEKPVSDILIHFASECMLREVE